MWEKADPQYTHKGGLVKHQRTGSADMRPPWLQRLLAPRGRFITHPERRSRARTARLRRRSAEELVQSLTGAERPCADSRIRRPRPGSAALFRTFRFPWLTPRSTLSRWQDFWLAVIHVIFVSVFRVDRLPSFVAEQRDQMIKKYRVERIMMKDHRVPHWPIEHALGRANRRTGHAPRCAAAGNLDIPPKAAWG